MYKETLTLAQVREILSYWRENTKKAPDDEQVFQRLCNRLFHDQHRMLLELLAIIEHVSGPCLPYAAVHNEAKSANVMIFMS